jgi:ferredoxin--NADP+ reductase
VNRILTKEMLSASVCRMRVAAPLIATERQAGQFIILQLADDSERVPLTIADADPEAGWIMIIFQTVGRTTQRLAELSVGDEIAHLVGPLGQPTHVEKVGRVICVGGGIGVAPMHPIAQAMKRAGNEVIIIMGARNDELLILRDEMESIADELIVCTDDGSAGRKELVTAPLKALCEQSPKPALVVAIGPPIMMKFCAETTRPFGVQTMVSLNTIMIDGTGMCGGCRVTVGGETKFVCVDGPEFDGHLVDFENMMLRLGAYRKREREDHDACRMERAAAKLEAQA